jgi:hypothetical protein
VGVFEEVVQENLELRKQIEQLTTRVEEIHDKHVDEEMSAEKFLAQFYRIMALQIAGEWKEIGDRCGWTPEQIATADVLAFVERQRIYRQAREYRHENEGDE